MRIILILSVALIAAFAAPVRADDKSAAPPTVPLTRQEVKQTLEEWKKVSPRLPLPLPTEEEKKQQGGRSVVNNARMHQLYLAPELRGAGFVREPDPNMSLDNTFKVELFWIIARVGNCRY